MRKIIPLLVAGLVAPLLAPGTVHARPVPTGLSALTKNPIYTSGKLPVRSCPEYSVTIEDFLTAQNYLREGAECLDATWTSFFKKARLPFRKPGMEFISKPTKTRACGNMDGFWGGAYCHDTQGLVVLVDGWMLEYEGTPFLFYVLAHEYGHHVQQRSGIIKAHYKLMPKSTKAAYKWHARLELQADCLSGAFLRSIWASTGRDSHDWQQLLTYIKEDMGDPTHGGGKSRAAWTDRGFKAGSPSVCNTYKAPASQVA
ncbi:neutral zinc metallopeptidase [Herbidospora cretacea]|uniref:neutral zinc metallopeptidase n=1 Tax=Herbidospora cretacea TaxID=28444 RepID=UPI0009DDC276|nr:neutral zinc metallopeptidase [Herbidospora cretacea]